MANGVVNLPAVDVTATAAAPVTYARNFDSAYFQRYEVYPYPNHCVVNINGSLYWEWETVQVHVEIAASPPRTFRLTVSEQTPWASDWAFLRIRPDDKCTIWLDGFKVITGKVITRQVFYDAKQHTVEIQGWDLSGVLNHATADTQTNEYKNQTPEALIGAIAGRHGVGKKTLGTIPSFKVDRFSVTPGESAREAITKIANAAGAQVSADENGNLELIGTDAQGGYAEAIEGVNILIGRETITSTETPKNLATAQRPGSDDQSGAEVAHQQHAQGQGGGGQMQTNMFARVLGEIPSMGIEQLKQRARIEDNVGDANSITVTLTMLGWQKPNGGLWWPMDIVFVESPMLIMERPLILKAVTYTQDDQSGTRSTIELVNMTAFGGGKAQASGGGDGGGQE
jgi:prophage tail gpP-like protein